MRAGGKTCFAEERGEVLGKLDRLEVCPEGDQTGLEVGVGGSVLEGMESADDRVDVCLAFWVSSGEECVQLGPVGVVVDGAQDDGEDGGCFSTARVVVEEGEVTQGAPVVEFLARLVDIHMPRW